MPLNSMTGFARVEGAHGAVRWHWELRSVNGKGLDARLRLPSGMDGIEARLRTELARHLKRGNCQINLVLDRAGEAAPLRVNRAALQVVLEAIRDLGNGSGGTRDVSRIPVEMAAPFSGQAPIRGHLQFIDNTVNAGNGTVHVRAEFDNPGGLLIPGQFARLRMGKAVTERSLLITDRAVGIDQDKKFVLVVAEDNTVAYREVTLGATVGRLRVVTGGLDAGERIVVNGLQRVRPGALVAPETVAMTPELPLKTASN